jgi:hypothetical protein
MPCEIKYWRYGSAKKAWDESISKSNSAYKRPKASSALISQFFTHIFLDKSLDAHFGGVVKNSVMPESPGD